MTTKTTTPQPNPKTAPEDWVECRFKDLLNYEQPTKYLVESTKYNDNYETPVLTAGKTFIKGYTDETSGIFDNLPTIIFDDFTTASQFVNFKFKVKSSAMKILTPSSKEVNMPFVFFAMQINKIRSDTHKRYWISKFSKKKFFLPPLVEQTALVAKIEQLFSCLDNGKTKLETAQKQLKVYRQAVLEKAFGGELTHIKLEKIKVKEIGDILTGKTPSKKQEEFYNSKDHNFYKPGDLNQGKNIFNSKNFLSKKGFENSRKVPTNSILVTCIGATIGKTGLIKKKGGFNQQINAIVTYEDYLPEFFYYQVISQTFQAQIKSKASSTTLPILNKGKFSELELNTTSFDRQTQIVKEIESRLSVCDKMEESIEQGLTQIKSLRQSILKKAFSGQLLSEKEITAYKQHPDYEPAEVLLEKIKKEKEK